MKKLFLLAVAFVAVTAFVGCSKDDDAPEINPELIVGDWQTTHSVGYVIDLGERYDFDKTFPDNGYYTGYIFNEDGKGTHYAAYTTSPNPEEPSPFTYTISGETLRIIEQGETQTFEIKELSTTKLVLYENNTDAKYVETTTYKKVK